MATLDNTTAKRLEIILEMIGTEANVLRHAMIDGVLAPSQSNDISPNLCYLLETISSKIGWLADLGIEKLTGHTDIVGDAEDWFLPPSYHDINREDKAVEVAHG